MLYIDQLPVLFLDKPGAQTILQPPCAVKTRGVNKDSVGGVNFFTPPRIFFTPPPREKYHDLYQITGFNWV